MRDKTSESPEQIFADVRASCEALGAAKEGAHIVGYELERVANKVKWLLQEDRWALCGFDDVGAFIDSVRLEAARPLVAERKEIAKLAKEADPTVSNRRIALMLGVHHSTVDEDIGGHPPRRQKKENENNEAENVSGGHPPPAAQIEDIAPPEMGGTEVGKQQAKIAEQAGELKGRVSSAFLRAFVEGKVSFSDAKKVAEVVPRETQDEWAEMPAGVLKETLDRWMRDRRRSEFFQSTRMPLLEGVWQVFYADPPWKDEFGPSARAIENHYATMTTQEILDLDVEAIAAPDAVLYLWAIPHMLQQALDVMRQWGFQYRTNLVWVKDSPGLGQWARNRHELLLIGRRGVFPPPVEELRVSSVIEAPAGEHSAKPEIFAELIEQWYPGATKVELFRRGSAREGWDAWGAEAVSCETGGHDV
jgi:N6-adenosine-specific RNA methylase IME4